jgi:membrane protein implicated in regulation of membrane protease activity
MKKLAEVGAAVLLVLILVLAAMLGPGPGIWFLARAVTAVGVLAVVVIIVGNLVSERRLLRRLRTQKERQG